MFKITFPNGGSALVEKPDFIRVHKNGKTFLLTERDKAEGVVYHGTPYLFKDGAMCHEVDAGDVYMTIDEMAAAIREGVNEV